MPKLPISCDLGEGTGLESDIMPFIDLCSLACGGHAGDMESLKEAMELASQYGVQVGAHPSYPDTQCFGRRSLPLTSEVLKETLLEQISLFQYVGSSLGLPMHHIKAHGALYHDVASDPILAHHYLNILEPFKETTFLIVPPDSELARKAQVYGFSLLYEAFADRRYNKDGRLVSRQEEGAILTNPKDVWNQYESLAKEGMVRVMNESVSVLTQTVCIHGDNPNAKAIVKYVSTQRELWISSS